MKIKEENMSIFLFVIVFQFVRLAKSQIVFEVKEEQQAPVLLGNIAVKARITSIPDLDFSLLSRKDMFEVDESNGDFKTKSSLDRENLCGSVPKCVITTSVAVSSAPDFFQRYTINVVVLDVNDQRPTFGIASFPRGLSERADVNTTIKLPLAYDADYEPEFKVQRYHLEPRMHTTFDLIVHRHNKSDGSAEFEVYLRLVQKMDREVIDSYTLTLVASDGGRPSNEGRLQIIISVIDENDNEPKFQESEYTKIVQEMTRVGTTVLGVSVRDADDGENARVGFEFSSDVDRKVLEFFEIDRVSGGVFLLRRLESEGGTTFVFKIKAFDHGTPMMFSEATVKISVEDTMNNPPSISVSLWRSKGENAVVPEDAVVGTKVALIDVLDTDSDNNGETHCIATSEYFSLDAYNAPGEYTVSVVKDLDREKTNTHSVILLCSDRGTPPLSSTITLSVIVDDVNDNRPVFTNRSYEMTVKENEEAGKLVGSVLAADVDEGMNAMIRYFLESSVSEFEINESNGNIYTSVKDLDREATDRYIFDVYAVDMGLFPMTGTATVTVNIEDVNDEYPRFDNSTYTFLVYENADINSTIGVVHARDLDHGLGGMVEYLLVHSPHHPNLPFSISPEDGALILIQPLDYETTKLYNFIATAVDLGKPPRNTSVEIQIQILDVNDNTPIIIFPSKDNLSVTLNLNFDPGQEVIKVLAHDPDTGDNGRLSYSYSLSKSSSSNLFWMNEDTGLITLASSLTEADVRSYNVVISVSDNGFPQRATHALLQVEIVQLEKRPKDSYIAIVIVMICVTLVTAIVVLVTFCLIKYTDNRKFYSDRDVNKSTFEPINKAPDYVQNGGVNDDIEKNSISNPSIQKQPLSFHNETSVSKARNSKKSVTFDNSILKSDITSEPASPQLSSCFNSDQSTASYMNPDPRILHGSYFPSTFRPFDSFISTNNSTKSPASSLSSSSPLTLPPVPSRYNANNIRTISESPSLDIPEGMDYRQECKKVKSADNAINDALQKHNALIRIMKSGEKTPSPTNRKHFPTSGVHDTDLYSSSSVETSDSGHGGSDQDISVSKVGV